MLGLVTTTATHMVAPLVAEFVATRQLNERQNIELRDQAELIGRLSSDLDQARATIDALRDSEARSQAVSRRAMLVLMILSACIIAGASAAAVRWLI